MTLFLRGNRVLKFFLGHCVLSDRSVVCSRVVCMVCQLSIPSSGTYIHHTRMRSSFNLF